MATRFVDRRVISNLGIYVYGAGAVALGVSRLVWTDFATNWQRVENAPGLRSSSSIGSNQGQFGKVGAIAACIARQQVYPAIDA
jgi:hypothetical protein